MENASKKMIIPQRAYNTSLPSETIEKNSEEAKNSEFFQSNSNSSDLLKNIKVSSENNIIKDDTNDLKSPKIYNSQLFEWIPYTKDFIPNFDINKNKIFRTTDDILTTKQYFITYKKSIISNLNQEIEFLVSKAKKKLEQISEIEKVFDLANNLSETLKNDNLIINNKEIEVFNSKSFDESNFSQNTETIEEEKKSLTNLNQQKFKNFDASNRQTAKNKHEYLKKIPINYLNNEELNSLQESLSRIEFNTNVEDLHKNYICSVKKKNIIKCSTDLNSVNLNPVSRGIRSNSKILPIDNEKVFIISPYSSQFCIYYFRTNKLKLLPSLLMTKKKPGFCFIGRFPAIIGGFGKSKYDALSSVEIFDGSLWSEFDSLNVKRFDCVGIKHLQYTYVFGGYDGDKLLLSIEKYDCGWMILEVLLPLAFIPIKSFSYNNDTIFIISANKYKANLGDVYSFDLITNSFNKEKPINPETHNIDYKDIAFTENKMHFLDKKGSKIIKHDLSN